MSRSYKRHPIYTPGRGQPKYWKRLTSRIARHTPDLGNGTQYRRLVSLDWCIYELHYPSHRRRDFVGHACLRQPWPCWKALVVRSNPRYRAGVSK